MLRKFSAQAKIVDSAGRLVRLSHTHRFRHTKLTRLAELGLPVHVLQRYAGHTNPTMSMHYVARREEHAEQAFLVTRDSVAQFVWAQGPLMREGDLPGS